MSKMDKKQEKWIGKIIRKFSKLLMKREKYAVFSKKFKSGKDVW